jgi:putative ABC transport system permease protein
MPHVPSVPLWRRYLRFWRADVAADVDDELRFHFDSRREELRARGLPPADVERVIAEEFGDVEATRWRLREIGERVERRRERLRWWHEARADLAYGVRGLRRSPGFTTGVVLTLALGIGANAAMFSLVDRLLFRPPPLMRDPATVHRVYLYRTTRGTERETGGQYARYADLVRWTTAFSQAATFNARALPVGTGDATRELRIGIVSAGFFRFFDAPPVLGRYFSDAEDSPPAGAPVAVLSHATWRTQYGARRDVLGSTVQIGSVVCTIVGVAPPGFVGLWPDQPPAAFIPVATYAASRGRPDWSTSYGTAIGLEMVVRREPGVTMAEATADLTNAFRRSYRAQLDAERRDVPMSQLRPRAVAASILEARGPRPSGVARVATWLSGVTLIVLVISCANVANLLLVRTLRRRREIAVRLALGVSRRRLCSQLLTEGMLLAALGGLAGLLVAVWGGAVLRAAFLPAADRVPLLGDPRTLLFAAAVSLGVGLVVGLVPMLHAGRAALTHDLKAGARDGTSARPRVRTALLVLQGALSVVLLVGAGLFVRSLRNVRDVRLGYDVDPVLVVDLDLRGVALDSARTAALRLRLLEAARTVPGVTHASLRESVPFAGSSSWPIFVAGIDSVGALGTFDLAAVSPDYFATMGTRLLRGRRIADTDMEGAPRVMVIGRAMGAALWPGQDPIGRCVRIGADTMPCTTVVGIAEDIRAHEIGAEVGQYYYYLPAAQWRPHDGGLFVRAQGDAGRLVEAVRSRLQREMPGASYVTVTRFADTVDGKMRSWIAGATVFTAFGFLALLLAAIGLYSVIAYNVAQRRRELGVRVALGAGRAAVVRLVVADGLRFGLAGVAIGSAIALAAGRWIGPLLFRQSPRDPVVFGVVIVALLAVALTASWAPALRAASLDPKTALQSD